MAIPLIQVEATSRTKTTDHHFLQIQAVPASTRKNGGFELELHTYIV